jgi:hypothetical protein
LSEKIKGTHLGRISINLNKYEEEKECASASGPTSTKAWDRNPASSDRARSAEWNGEKIRAARGPGLISISPLQLQTMSSTFAKTRFVASLDTFSAGRVCLPFEGRLLLSARGVGAALPPRESYA